LSEVGKSKPDIAEISKRPGAWKDLGWREDVKIWCCLLVCAVAGREREGVEILRMLMQMWMTVQSWPRGWEE
jgi:hypothetical protein